jgi:hypothetical protein
LRLIPAEESRDEVIQGEELEGEGDVAEVTRKRHLEEVKNLNFPVLSHHKKHVWVKSRRFSPRDQYHTDNVRKFT